MAFTKGDVKALRDELQAVVDKYAADHGIKVTFGNATYSDADISFKVKVVATGSEGADNEKANWIKNCAYVGLVVDDFGKQIKINGDDFVVCGLKNSARKNIVAVRKVKNGEVYVISRDTFIRCGGQDGFAKWKVNVA